jgi:hypothetical protein
MADRPVARPKNWRRTHYTTTSSGTQPPGESPDKWPTTAAPGHNGGSFSNAGPYLPYGIGAFGFRQTS